MRPRDIPHLLRTHLPSHRGQARADLRLSGVYVCAPDALVLLSDNFDYQTVARDLVPGVLSEQELGSTLHVYELARVRQLWPARESAWHGARMSVRAAAGPCSATSSRAPRRGMWSVPRPWRCIKA